MTGNNKDKKTLVEIYCEAARKGNKSASDINLWDYIALDENGYEIYTNERDIAKKLKLPDAKLIVTAVNNCIKLNPDNPQAVAEAIPKLYEALKATARGQSNPSWGKLVDEALSLVEGK